MTFISDRLAQNEQLLDQQKQSERQKNMRKSSSRFLFEPTQIMQTLRAQIVGQDEALDEIQKMLSVVKADFCAKDKPLSVSLLLGPTGVGKTETVRIISQCIHQKPNVFCRIDMNTLAQEHYTAALTGAPPGYVGSKEGNTLFDTQLIAGSFSKPGIVLFDEIEKASNEVIRALLNVLDTGKLNLTAGTKQIDFSNCMIFMTSNLGAKVAQERITQLDKIPSFAKSTVTDWADKLGLDAKAVIDKSLRKKFDPEFINRIDRIIHYKPVQVDFLFNLIDIEIDKLNTRLQKQDRQIIITECVKNYLVKDYDIGYGARGLGRKIRTHIEPLIAEHYLNYPDDQKLVVTFLGQNLIAQKAD